MMGSLVSAVFAFVEGQVVALVAGIYFGVLGLRGFRVLGVGRNLVLVKLEGICCRELAALTDSSSVTLPDC